jgi:hypothetical protein
VATEKLFSGRPVGTVAIVDAPVSQWYVRRARAAFLVVGVVSGVVTAAVVAVFASTPLAVVLGILAGAVCGFVSAVLVRAWPVLRMVWWWSIEIAAAAAVVLLQSSLAQAARPWIALTVVVLVVGVCTVVGPVRRFVSVWSWCLVVRHRLRLCFAGIVRGSGGTRPGLLPLILWAQPTPAGERVWLWLRPGLELADLDGKTGRIAVVCWAKQVRVVPASEKYAGFVRVDIARRDPLAGRVDSPLALLIPSLRNTNTTVKPESSPLPPVGLDLADIAEPAPEPPTRGGRR